MCVLYIKNQYNKNAKTEALYKILLHIKFESFPIEYLCILHMDISNCMHVCLHVYMHECMCVCTYISTYASTYVCMYVWLYVWIYVCVYECTTCMYIIYVCMYV